MLFIILFTPDKQRKFALPLRFPYNYLTTWTRAHQSTQLFNFTSLDSVYTIVVLLSSCECVVALGISAQDMYDWKEKSCMDLATIDYALFTTAKVNNIRTCGQHQL